MNAIDFFKQHKIEKVKALIEQYDQDQFAFKSFDLGADCCFDAGLYAGEEKAWWDICIYDLKRLVESVELIKTIGGIEIAKRKVNMADFYGFLLISFQAKDGLASVYIQKVQQAIADYESIYGGEHV